MNIRTLKKILKLMLIIGITIIALIIYNYFFMGFYSKKYLYSNISEIPHKKVGLVLGTSQFLMNGRENLFFTNRIKAASDLYKYGKVDFLLVSGDNSLLTYNEPAMMKKALIKKGVPDSLIYLDYAGFRTLDALERSKKVFLENDIIIISQKFHNERALFIAKNRGIKAIALNAKDVPFKAGFNTYIREFFARIKAFLDIYFFKTQPKFLGEPIKIE